MAREIHLLTLREQMQGLPDEAMAVYADMNLGFLKEDDIDELLGIAEDPTCDHPDGDPSWTQEGARHRAADANSRLFHKLIELAPDYVAAHAIQLLNRRSRAFTYYLRKYLVRTKCQPIEVFLKHALAKAAPDEIYDVLFEFKYGLARASLSPEQREAIFDLIEPYFQMRQERYNKIDVGEILGMLSPERANQYFAKFIPLDPEHEMFGDIVGHPGFFKSEQSVPELKRLFEYFDSGAGRTAVDRVVRLQSIVAVVIAKHNREFVPLLEKSVQSRDARLRRMALRGLVLLRLPHDPLRKARELVETKRFSELSAEVRLIGFASLYANEFNTNSVLNFSTEVSSKVYAECMKALGQLGLVQHLSLLSDLWDELGEDPHRAMRKMKDSTYARLEARYSKLAEKLDMEQVSEAMHAYVLQHESAFMAEVFNP